MSKKKIKVLEIIGDATLAGAPRHLLSLLENLDYNKFEVFVISTSGPLTGEIKAIKKPIDLEIIPMRSKFDLKAMGEIKRTTKHINPDLIHIHGTRAGVVARLALIGYSRPVVYTEHLWTKDYRLSDRFAHYLQLFGLWFLDMFTSINIAVSQAVKDFLVESQISRSEKIVVVYNGVEPPSRKAKPFVHKDEFKIGSIGTLNEQKGMQYLISAMPKILREFPKTTLEIIGEGSYKDQLIKQISRLKLGAHVKLTGFANDVYDKLEKLDLYVQPSLSESFGLAILQAMSMGLPVVATNTGGIPEVVTSSKTGILVEPKNSSDLAKAVLDILRDPEKAKAMGKLGKEDAEIKFSLQDMVEETEKIYIDITEKNSVR